MKKPYITLTLVTLTCVLSTASFAEKRFSKEDQNLLDAYQKYDRGGRPPKKMAPPPRPPAHRPPAHRAPFHKGGNVYERRAQLERQIQRGIDKSELVRPERRELQAELRKITRLIEIYRADGVFSLRESNQIHNMMNSLERNIERKRSDYLRRRNRR